MDNGRILYKQAVQIAQKVFCARVSLNELGGLVGNALSALWVGAVVLQLGLQVVERERVGNEVLVRLHPIGEERSETA